MLLEIQELPDSPPVLSLLLFQLSDIIECFPIHIHLVIRLLYYVLDCFLHISLIHPARSVLIPFYSTLSLCYEPHSMRRTY